METFPRLLKKKLMPPGRSFCLEITSLSQTLLIPFSATGHETKIFQLRQILEENSIMEVTFITFLGFGSKKCLDLFIPKLTSSETMLD